MKRCWPWLFLFLATAAPLRAQAPGEPIRLTLRPAAVPVPALKYELLPPLIDQTPGNAALIYLRAESPEWWLNMLREPSYMERVDQARQSPLKELPHKEFDQWLHSKQLREVDLAARKEQCDWELNARIKSENIYLLLPEVQGLRQLAKLLALRARLEMAAGNLDKALYTLQTGLAMAQHVNRHPILISNLVAASIAMEMIDQLDTLVQQPGAPNLYWALASLPNRLVDLRRNLQGETLSMSGLLPSRPELEAGPLTPQQVVKLLDPFLKVLAAEAPSKADVGWQRQLLLTGLTAKFYPRAKELLLRQGRPAAVVEAMPALQVVALYSLFQYERLRDEMFKWFNLPYWQARPGVAEADRQIRTARQSMEEGIPFASYLLPAVTRVNSASIRVERRLAALRLIEAIRLHAAAHGGSLPDRLSDITVVPVPDDPATGKSFEFRASGNKITFVAPLPPGEAPHSGNSFRYELTLSQE